MLPVAAPTFLVQPVQQLEQLQYNQQLHLQLSRAQQPQQQRGTPRAVAANQWQVATPQARLGAPTTQHHPQ